MRRDDTAGALHGAGDASAAATQRNIPTAGEYDWKVDDSASRHAVPDMDGDGLPDFVDSEDDDLAYPNGEGHFGR